MPVFISYEISLVFSANDYFCSQLQQIKEEIYLVVEKWWLLWLSVLVFNKTGTAPSHVIQALHCLERVLTVWYWACRAGNSQCLNSCSWTSPLLSQDLQTGSKSSYVRGDLQVVILLSPTVRVYGNCWVTGQNHWLSIWGKDPVNTGNTDEGNSAVWPEGVEPGCTCFRPHLRVDPC